MDIIYRFDPHAPLVANPVKSADEALKKLAAGNERFNARVCHIQDAAQLQNKHSEIIVPVTSLSLGVPFISGVAPAHSPFALILGCSDARVPLETVMDCASNEMFVVRVAGNVLGLECLGSIDYAVCNLKESMRTVVVMGHTGCGAVAAAVEIYLTPSDFPGIAFSHALRSLVDRIMLTVRGSDRALKRVLGDKISRAANYKQLLVETSVYMNAVVTSHDLQREVASLSSEMEVVYSIYDVAHARITALPYDGNNSVPAPFATAPKDASDFERIATEVIQRLVN
jgi:carbonic anhydrase